MVWINTPKPGQPRILVVLHQETSTPGRVGLMLQEMGYALDIVRPPMGQELPETLENHEGAVIFGGPMSANDGDEYVKREIDWISVPLKENKPFFGICLGAQMMVKQLGGEVNANEREFAEIGYYPLRPTNEGADLMEWPGMIYQWHREGFSLPSQATLLATGDEYPNQAIRVGERAYGVQFHSELTLAMMNRWTVRGAHRFCLNGAHDRKQHLEGRYLYDAAVRKWLRDFLDLWIGPACAKPVNSKKRA
ncbi:MAG: glutamine amidotransferase [Rhizobiaceae bacterium]